MWSRGEQFRRLARACAARTPTPTIAVALCSSSGALVALWCSGCTGSTASTSAGDEKAFTTDEVATRDGVGGRRAWITVGSNVYDLTDYVAAHPGGDRILSAAGGAAEPFFAQWPAHWDRNDRAAVPGSIAPRVSEQVRQALRPYYIGALRDGDTCTAVDNATIVREAFCAEPERVLAHPAAPGLNGLDVVTHLPFQAEPKYFGRSHEFHTPNALFYVRNHGPVPDANRDTFRLTIGSTVFSVQELEQNFKQQKISATLQCTGNRLDELSGVGKTQFAGKAGSKGFISNAEWEGPLLSEVMAAAKVGRSGSVPYTANDRIGKTRQSIGEDDGWHLEVEGADGFVVSLPWSYVTKHPVLLVTRMNGEKLPPDHGAPVRLLVPGAVGARSVKWVVRAETIWGSSQSPWQRRFYRGGSSNSSSQSANESPILEWPVQGIITSVNHGDAVELEQSATSLSVSGVAYCGGGHGIQSVVVSANGCSWFEARLEPPPGQPDGQRYAWTLWNVDVPIPARLSIEAQALQLRCRATDTGGAVQPQSIVDVWTPSGYLCNAEHSVTIYCARKQSGRD